MYGVPVLNDWTMAIASVCYACRIFAINAYTVVGGTVASWLLCSSPDPAVRVRALAWGHCVVSLGKRLNSHDSASLHPGV